jgi:AraC-like DNA-binding protein
LSTKTRAAVIHGFDQLVEELGGDYRKVANQAGLDMGACEDPNTLIPSMIVKHILDYSARETGCSHFGLLLAEHHDQESHLGLLGQVIQSSPTLGVALEDGFNFISLHTGASIWQLHTSDEVTYITYALVEGAESGSEQIQQFVMTSLWQLLHTITAHQWRPTMINFSFKKPADMAPYRRTFGIPIMFNSDFCGVIFHSSDLKIELPEQNENLHDALRLYAAEVAKRKPLGFSEQIRILIRKNLEIHKVNAEAVTQFMPFEKRTMQRRLREEGTSYRSLLNEVRVELAKDWLSNSDIPITRLAERLQYSGLATMTRAFKTQTGFTPKAWRNKTK